MSSPCTGKSKDRQEIFYPVVTMINVSKQTYSLKALLEKKEKLLLHSLNPLFSLGIKPATEE